MERGAKIIIAVSGGIDSVVMLDLFSKSDYECMVAHCNFNLRGNESLEDEGFVKSLENKYGIPVHSKSFDTKKYAEENKISIQMAARDLRYDWFEELLSQHQFDSIATAHNLNDQVETFFINLARGTGIKGLSGIKERYGNLIRPLLWASRDQIREYADTNNLEWREDSSNSSMKYTRNKIRHEILPLLKVINPAFSETMQLNLKKLRDVEKIYLTELDVKKRYLLIPDEKSSKIHIPSLLKEKNYRVWLYEILQEYGFTSGTVDDISLALRKKESGKKFYSEKYRVIKDREYLIIGERLESDSRRFYIEDGQKEISKPIAMEIEELDKADFKHEKSLKTAQLDYDKVSFPLIIRKWEKGDYFMPLGMQNLKKVSDFFIDQKMSIPEKEKTWLLANGKHIVWVIGQRIDERFKITDETEIVLRIRLKD